MERIVFLERDTVQAEFRRPNFDHEWVEYPESAQHQVLDRLRGATIVISNKLALREPELSRVPELKLERHAFALRGRAAVPARDIGWYLGALPLLAREFR